MSNNMAVHYGGFSLFLIHYPLHEPITGVDDLSSPALSACLPTKSIENLRFSLRPNSTFSYPKGVFVVSIRLPCSVAFC